MLLHKQEVHCNKPEVYKVQRQFLLPKEKSLQDITMPECQFI